MRTVLVSRRDIPPAVHRRLDPTSVASLREEDLAFTVEEAAEALRLNDNATTDPAQAVSATGGWVTGVRRRCGATLRSFSQVSSHSRSGVDWPMTPAPGRSRLRPSRWKTVRRTSAASREPPASAVNTAPAYRPRGSLS